MATAVQQERGPRKNKGRRRNCSGRALLDGGRSSTLQTPPVAVGAFRVDALLPSRLREPADDRVDATGNGSESCVGGDALKLQKLVRRDGVAAAVDVNDRRRVDGQTDCQLLDLAARTGSAFKKVGRRVDLEKSKRDLEGEVTWTLAGMVIIS